MTAHRCAYGLKKKFDLRSDSKRHRQFVKFFNVPVQAPIRGQPFYGYSEKPSHLVAFYDTLGIRRTNSRLKHPGSPWGNIISDSHMKRCIEMKYKAAIDLKQNETKRDDSRTEKIIIFLSVVFFSLTFISSLKKFMYHVIAAEITKRCKVFAS